MVMCCSWRAERSFLPIFSIADDRCNARKDREKKQTNRTRLMNSYINWRNRCQQYNSSTGSSKNSAATCSQSAQFWANEYRPQIVMLIAKNKYTRKKKNNLLRDLLYISQYASNWRSFFVSNLIVEFPSYFLYKMSNLNCFFDLWFFSYGGILHTGQSVESSFS